MEEDSRISRFPGIACNVYNYLPAQQTSAIPPPMLPATCLPGTHNCLSPPLLPTPWGVCFFNLHMVSFSAWNAFPCFVHLLSFKMQLPRVTSKKHYSMDAALPPPFFTWDSFSYLFASFAPPQVSVVTSILLSAFPLFMYCLLCYWQLSSAGTVVYSSIGAQCLADQVGDIQKHLLNYIEYLGKLCLHCRWGDKMSSFS